MRVLSNFGESALPNGAACTETGDESDTAFGGGSPVHAVLRRVTTPISARIDIIIESFFWDLDRRPLRPVSAYAVIRHRSLFYSSECRMDTAIARIPTQVSICLRKLCWTSRVQGRDNSTNSRLSTAPSLLRCRPYLVEEHISHQVNARTLYQAILHLV